MRRLLLIGLLSAIATLALLVLRPAVPAPATPSSGADLLAFGAWCLAVAVCAWTATIAAVGAVAMRTRRAGVVRIAVRLTPRLLRHALEIALAGSVVVAAAVPAGAAPAQPPPPQAAVAYDEPVVRAPDPDPAPVPAPAPPTPPAAPTTVSPPTTTPARAHRVVPGDNLWRIARAEVEARGGATDTAVARYWTALIAVNRSTLRSGNPNLIYPGELVALPDPT